VLSIRAGKDALISCGEMFVEEAKWQSALWMIEPLKNDPDPPFPNLMHDRLAGGQNYFILQRVDTG
jgi:hypothetical protein